MNILIRSITSSPTDGTGIIIATCFNIEYTYYLQGMNRSNYRTDVTRVDHETGEEVVCGVRDIRMLLESLLSRNISKDPLCNDASYGWLHVELIRSLLIAEGTLGLKKRDLYRFLLNSSVNKEIL